MPDDLPSRDIPAAVRRGAPWVIGGQVATQLISLGSLAYLYRQLTPEEYGLFGMALSFILLPRMLATLGLSIATVQRSSLCADERNSLFWLQAALGVAFSLVAAATAPLAAYWFGTREVIPLVLALSGTVFVVSLSATQQSLLERNLALARITSVRVLGQLIGTLIAIFAASLGWRCGALVVQQYAELTAMLVSVWIIAPWWPRWPRKFVNARELFHFSGYFTLSSLLSFVIQNADKLLLGWWLGGTPAGQAIVGAYTQAYNLVMRPVYSITAPVFGVLLPTLSRAKSEPQLFQHLTVTAYRLTAIMLLPC
ncbi:MAG TPA: oligosaccharide flippase family protein, partial [Pirellulaceae bacterium]|nr:oligosaccharide flippase family protein [Pirellulaceae bacterium]